MIMYGVCGTICPGICKATQDRPADPAAQDTISIVLSKIERQEVRLTVVDNL